MKATIYMVTMTSYTASDNNLYNNTWTYDNEEEARQQYISLRDEQSEECRWGADYDNDDHKDDCEYTFSEREDEDGNTYEASSEAYEGYRVQVKLEKQEVEIAYATDRRKYGMTLKEIRDEIAAFTGDNKSEDFARYICGPEYRGKVENACMKIIGATIELAIESKGAWRYAGTMSKEALEAVADMKKQFVKRCASRKYNIKEIAVYEFDQMFVVAPVWWLMCRAETPEQHRTNY